MDAYKNFAYGVVLTPPAPASSGTSAVLAAGHGARFPAAPFNATVWPAGAIPDPVNAEIVRVTAIATDTLTLTRAQEGSTARAIVAGDQLAATMTAVTLDSLRNAGELNAGTLLDARLSANVARRDVANTFLGSHQLAHASGYAELVFASSSGPVGSRNWQVLNAGDRIYYKPLTDDQTAYTGQSLSIDRSGRLFERDRTVPMGELIPFTPTFGDTNGSLAIGNGTLSGAYTLVGKLCHVFITLTWGSTSNFGAGGVAYLLGFPVPWSGAYYQQLPGHLLAGGLIYGVSGMPQNVAQFHMRIYGTSGAYTKTSPVAAAAGDSVFIAGAYSIA